ncbi:MAG: hypothetical protein PCFJNLEI_00012 [Verrucomicrobiae bacterium]|nr:hypothetical protein [Verrucomicrobiae bacterium]
MTSRLDKFKRVVGRSRGIVVRGLLLASSVAAASAAKPEFDLNLQVSTYVPTQTRDPFAKATAVASETAQPVGVPVGFQLDGILYQATAPSAIVNGTLVTLNKSVEVTVKGTPVKVKATAITRREVTLEVNGQKVELQLNPENSTTSSAEKQ